MIEQTKAMELALEYLEQRELAWNVQIALREALASEAIEQPAQQELMKQVTIVDAPSCLNTHDKAMWVLGWNECVEAAPAQRTWVGLTEEEILIMSRYDLEYAALIGEVQRKLKEKNT